MHQSRTGYSAAIAVATGIALACGVGEAGLTILDNTNDGAMTLPTGAGTAVTIRPNRYFAYAFSSTASQTLESMTVGVVSASGSPETRNATIALYATSGGLPTGTALAQTSSSVTAQVTPNYVTFPLPSSFAIASGTTYALSFTVDSGLSDNNFRWNYGNPTAFPTGSNGVTFVGAAESDGSAWTVETTIKPTMQVQAVPEPAMCAAAAVAAAAAVGLRRRRRSTVRMTQG